MINIEKYGFSLVRESPLDEIDATLYELSHNGCGARIIYLDREDENKTFAIGFATPPTDDTGVFHIIEHSVLCGSENYPLNDPFAELLKGSLNTFLNAMTYEDRTVYPVSSRCESDFLNLADIYMDAVFSPNLLKNPSIFRQEGWHYEYDEETNTLSYNGVVYNEMKGVYSSPDELGAAALNSALFSGTPYSCDSGGAPSAIPSLTYEGFKASHEKYYHPSAARIFLDGRIDLDKILPLINAHLEGYEKRELLYLDGRSEPRDAGVINISYEISEGEEEHGKARVLYGYVFTDWSDAEGNLTASILCDLLCGSNASPLKKALLDGGLAKDAQMYVVKSREQTLVIEVRDADETRLDEIDAVVKGVITSMIEDGIDKNKITSTLNSIEFRLREQDFGALPTGIVYAMTLYGHWVYSDRPEKCLLLDAPIKAVREKIPTEHFEKELRRITLDNPHRAKVIMLPDKTLGERNSRAEAEGLAAIFESISEDELQKIRDEETALRLWQQSEPTEEALASIPRLSLSDIPEKSDRPFATVGECDGVKIVTCPIKTNGIVYVSLLFDASDLAGDELVGLSMLAAALLNYPTEKYDALSMQNEIKANLGNMFASFTIGNKDGIATPYLKIAAKALDSKRGDVIRLISELLTTKIEDASEMANILAQTKSNIEDTILQSGESVALSRAQAGRNEVGAASEHLSGYEAYCTISKILKNQDTVKEFTCRVAELLKKLMTKARLTVAVAGETSEEYISELISLFPEGSSPERKRTPICAEKSEYFLLPSKVAYAVMAGGCDRARDNLGILRVARSILSYEYLWNTVRVQGGAYGTGFIPRKDGDIAFYSYRDPSPNGSLGFYRASSDYLRSLVRDGVDITKFIIGAIGEYDTLITPRTAIALTTADYLNGWNREDEAAIRADMLNMTAEDLLTVADIIDEALADESIIIVGGREQLDALDEKPGRIITI